MSIKAFSVRRIVASIGIVLLVIACCGIAAGFHKAPVASAHTPHPGLDFSIGIDTNGDTVVDCGTGVSQNPNCVIASGSTFRLRVYLNSLGGAPPYGGFDIYIEYAGVSSKANPDAHAWPDCVFQASATFVPGVVGWGCTIGVPPAPGSTYTGLIGTTDFNCNANGTVTMVHGGDMGNYEPQRTFLTEDNTFENHAEGQLTTEALTITCVNAVGGMSLDTPGDHGSGVPGMMNPLLLALSGLATMLGICWARRRWSL